MKDTMLESEEAFKKAISNTKNRQQHVGSESGAWTSKNI
jgi:hypothetical protein